MSCASRSHRRRKPYETQKKKHLFSNMEGLKNLFLSLFLESLRLGPKVPSRVALTPSTRRVQF